MNKSIKSRDIHKIFMSDQKGFEGLKDRFFELYVLRALSKNLKMAVEIAQQDN